MISYFKKVSLKALFIALLSLSSSIIKAQCFEIESILVDACGNPENGNEMVRFKVGASSLDANNLNVIWPNNGWQGLVQDATTATTTANLNSTVTGCGILIEPPSFILPSGANVLLITSQFVNVTANSFTNLSDTLYVIYQDLPTPTNNGHFSNSASTPRTLTISFSSPPGCNDDVTYLPTSLIGSGGATVDFDPAGNPTYFNNGCQAPFTPTGITADTIITSSLTICPGDSIDIFATVIGSFQSIFWSGGTGSFSNATSDTTTYFSSLNDVASFNLILGGVTLCNDTIFDTLLVNIPSPINVTIAGNDTLDLCQGQNLNLTANGAINYVWNNASTTNPLVVSAGGTYSVTGNNTCFSSSDSVFVNLILPVSVNILSPDTVSLCQGESVTLQASGASNYLWSNNSIFDSLVVSTAGSFFVTTSNTCFTASDTVQINITPQLNITITENGPINLCAGENVVLHANGGNEYLWSTAAITDSITVNTQGLYFVTDTTNRCFNDTAFIQVNTAPILSITLTENGPINICQGESITLHANGANNYLWNTTATTDSLTVNTTGTYFVYGNEACPSDTASIVVNVILPTNFTISENNPTILCVGDQLVLHATTGLSNYFWNNIAGTDLLTINTSGVYTATASDGVCPTVSASILIIDDVIPTATIIGDNFVCIGSSLTLNASGIGGFSWSTGSTGNSTSITTGQQVILTATNGCGNIATDVIIVTEEDCSIETGITIPNVFTPNGDDFNDIFKVEGINITSITGSIYNRWGVLLLEWSGIDNGWNGKDYNEGTYFYIIKATFINETTEEFKGAVLLLK